MTRTIRATPLIAEDFKPFGDVIEIAGAPDRIINQGLCGRFHDCAVLDFSDGQAGISLFHAQPRAFPFTLDMVERHPDGSQAFLPMTDDRFLVVVAPDVDGQPGQPIAFVTRQGQGVNYHRGVWHGVLAPLGGSGRFAVIDRIGSGPNLEEHWFETPFVIADV